MTKSFAKLCLANFRQMIGSRYFRDNPNRGHRVLVRYCSPTLQTFNQVLSSIFARKKPSPSILNIPTALSKVNQYEIIISTQLYFFFPYYETPGPSGDSEIYNKMKSAIIIIVFIQLLASGQSACPATCSTCASTTCTSCISGYYLSSGSCQSCADPNCATCDSTGTVCTVCKHPYGLRISDSVCVTCLSIYNSNCYPTSYAVCNNFALNGIGQCRSCSTVYRNCLKCDNSHCLQCNTGYALNSTVNLIQCVVCRLPRCLVCGNGPVCLKCSSGYYPVNGVCTPCSLPCSSCSSATTCFSCETDTSLYIYSDSANTCLNCNDSTIGITGCATCSQDTITLSISCLTCLPGYYIAGSCLNCIAPCLTCTNSVACLSCVNNAYLYNPSTYRCQSCGFYVPNCVTCTSTTICLTCSAGYVVSSNPSACVSCSSIVPACQFCSPIQCNSCFAGYTLQLDYTCSPVCQSPCIRCTDIATVCKSCIFGYYLSGTTCIICNVNCTSCVNSTFCISCITQFANINGTCQPCQLNEKFDPFSQVCLPCQTHCTSCTWWTGCDTCESLFQLSMVNGVNTCRDICGDTYAIESPCDFALGVPNDGCTDVCTIQPNYNCTKSLNSFTINGTATSVNTSQCSYIGSISISIYAASQSISTNTLTLTFSIRPYLYGFPTNADTQSYIQSIFQLGPLGTSDDYTVNIDTASSLVTFEVHHNSDISQLGLSFTINTAPLSSNLMFQYVPATTYAFQPNKLLTYGRLGQYQQPDMLNQCKLLYSWSKLLAICSIVIMFIGMFGKELVALDQVVLCQGVFSILAFYQGQLNLPMLSLTGLKYSAGVYLGPDIIPLSQNQHYIVGLDTTSFLYNFNFNLFAYVPPLLISGIVLIYKLRYKHLPSRRDLAQQTYEVIMGQTILYLAVFNLAPLISYAYIFYTHMSKDYYYDSITIFIASLFTIFGIFNYFIKPQIVGVFRSCFRAQSDMREAKLTGCRLKYTNCISKRFFQQQLGYIYNKITINFFVIYLLYLFTYNLLIVFNIASPITIVGMQIFMLTLIVLVRPHFHVLQKLRAIITWALALLGSLIVLLKPSDFLLPMIFLTFLSIHSVMAVCVIVISVIQQIKRKCNDRSEVVRKLMKEGQIQTEKAALRELILRYQNLSRKHMTIDHQVQKIQMKFNQEDNSKSPEVKKQHVRKLQNFKENQDQQMIQFEDEIIQQEHDHFRFQKGMEFFDKYDGKIDQGLVNKEYEILQ